MIPRFIATLGAALWAINPIHTQAVTYIVQRMAILAALFYILGIYLYLKGRLSQDRSGKILYFYRLSGELSLGPGIQRKCHYAACLIVIDGVDFFPRYSQGESPQIRHPVGGDGPFSYWLLFHHDIGEVRWPRFSAEWIRKPPIFHAGTVNDRGENRHLVHWADILSLSASFVGCP